MPRHARLDAPGALHHIMVRGIDKSNIFRDEEDKTRFLERSHIGDVVTYIAKLLTLLLEVDNIASCHAMPA